MANSLQGICRAYLDYKALRFGSTLGAALSGLMYRKLLRSPAAIIDRALVINIVSNDVRSFEEAASSMQRVVVEPVQTVILFVLLTQELGWKLLLLTIAGFFFIILLMNLAGKVYETVQTQKTVARDERIGRITEIIRGIETIKLNAYESVFLERVTKSRLIEMAAVSKNFVMRVIFEGITEAYVRTFSFGSLLSHLDCSIFAADDLPRFVHSRHTVDTRNIVHIGEVSEWNSVGPVL